MSEITLSFHDIQFCEDLGQHLLDHIADRDELDMSIHDEAAAAFGNYIRDVRRSQGVTREQLGAAVSLSVAHITALENGLILSTEIKAAVLNRLAQALGEELSMFELLLDREIPDFSPIGAAKAVYWHTRLINAFFGSITKTISFMTAGFLLLLFLAVNWFDGLGGLLLGVRGSQSIISLNNSEQVLNQFNTIIIQSGLLNGLVQYSMIAMFLYWLFVLFEKEPAVGAFRKLFNIPKRNVKEIKRVALISPVTIVLLLGSLLLIKGYPATPITNESEVNNSSHGISDMSGNVWEWTQSASSEGFATNIIGVNETSKKPIIQFEIGPQSTFIDVTSLPVGLHVTSSSGNISGTPSPAGSFEISVSDTVPYPTGNQWVLTKMPLPLPENITSMPTSFDVDLYEFGEYAGDQLTLTPSPFTNQFNEELALKKRYHPDLYWTVIEASVVTENVAVDQSNNEMAQISAPQDRLASQYQYGVMYQSAPLSMPAAQAPDFSPYQLNFASSIYHQQAMIIPPPIIDPPVPNISAIDKIYEIRGYEGDQVVFTLSRYPYELSEELPLKMQLHPDLYWVEEELMWWSVAWESEQLASTLIQQPNLPSMPVLDHLNFELDLSSLDESDLSGINAHFDHGTSIPASIHDYNVVTEDLIISVVDRDLDVTAVNQENFGNWLYLNDQGGALQIINNFTEEEPSRGVAFGDWDGEGDLDLAADTFWQGQIDSVNSMNAPNSTAYVVWDDSRNTDSDIYAQRFFSDDLKLYSLSQNTTLSVPVYWYTVDASTESWPIYTYSLIKKLPIKASSIGQNTIGIAVSDITDHPNENSDRQAIQPTVDQIQERRFFIGMVLSAIFVYVMITVAAIRYGKRLIIGMKRRTKT